MRTLARDLHALVPWTLLLECIGDDECHEALREMEREVDELLRRGLYHDYDPMNPKRRSER